MPYVALVKYQTYIITCPDRSPLSTSNNWSTLTSDDNCNTSLYGKWFNIMTVCAGETVDFFHTENRYGVSNYQSCWKDILVCNLEYSLFSFVNRKIIKNSWNLNNHIIDRWVLLLQLGTWIVIETYHIEHRHWTSSTETGTEWFWHPFQQTCSNFYRLHCTSLLCTLLRTHKTGARLYSYNRGQKSMIFTGSCDCICAYATSPQPAVFALKMRPLVSLVTQNSNPPEGAE